jgi:hypothetical protein
MSEMPMPHLMIQVPYSSLVLILWILKLGICGHYTGELELYVHKKAKADSEL